VNYRILYFASLRDAAGRDVEDVASDTHDARELYRECSQRYGFALSVDRLRFALNGEFANWDRPITNGDEIAFLPPVSGG
jgi:molybdopterin synthase sulfur carrier subunit